MSTFATFEIQIFQTASDGETAKTKVVDLKKLYNFVVEHFFISIRLELNTYFKFGCA
jgi:hypothetical protein